MTSPLRLSFEVGCRPQAAFRLWTEAIGTWWPADHTVSGDPATVVFEGRVGGRVFERARDGTEHVWGEVTRWDPPSRIAYTWYLGSRSDDATEVEIRFMAGEGDTTVVEVQHTGWERLGDQAEAWRDRNRAGWQSLIPYLAAAAASETGASLGGRPQTGRGMT